MPKPLALLLLVHLQYGSQHPLVAPETIVICPTEHQRALWPATGRGHTPLILRNLSSRLGSKALCGQLRYVCLYAREDYEHGMVCFIGRKV